MTPEDQARIHAEEAEREKIRAGFRRKRKEKILLGCGLALAGVVILPLVALAGIAFLSGFFGAVSDSPAVKYVPPESIVGSISNDKPVAANWKTLASWKGSSIKNTETFSTTAREWRIKWVSGGLLSIFVYDANRNLVTVAVNTAEAASDISYVRAAPGSFYLEIICVGHPWVISVEQK